MRHAFAAAPRARRMPTVMEALDWACLAALFGTYFAPFIGFLGPIGTIATILRWPVLFGTIGWLGLRALMSRSGSWSLNMQQLLVALWLGSMALSSLISDTPRVALMKLVALGLVMLLVVWILPLRLTLAGWRLLLVAVGGVVLAMTLPSLVVGESISEDYYRTKGFLGSGPNATGVIGTMALGLALPWSTYLWTTGRKRAALAVAGACVGTMGVLLATGSRSSAAGSVGALGVWWLTLGRGNWGQRLGIAFGGLLLLAVASQVAFAQQQTAFLLRERGVGLSAFESRAEIWTESVAAWKKRPMLGYGYGASGMTEDVEGIATQAFSVRDGSGYFGLLEATGVIGVALFGGVLLSLARPARRLARLPATDPDRAAGLAALACIGGLCVNHVGEPWLLGPGSPINLVFWTCVAAVPVLARTTATSMEPSAPMPPIHRASHLPPAVQRRLERNRRIARSRAHASPLESTRATARA